MNIYRHIDFIIVEILKILRYIKRNPKFFILLNCLGSLYIALMQSILEFSELYSIHILQKINLNWSVFETGFSPVQHLLNVNVPIHNYDQLRNLFKMPSISSRI